ncbi:MAG: c-type cytochrome [Bacteroidota bacterium]
MNKTIVLTCLIALAVLGLGWTSDEGMTAPVTLDTPVWEVLKKLGAAAPKHDLRTDLEGVDPEMGKNLVLYGYKKKGQGLGTPQSKHFKCTACHNVQREDPDLSVSDPEARLTYAQEMGLPFLQGTTLYGAVDRSSFYNDDYEKKYGDLVKPTRDNLREAIQLCAIECSQGRRLDEVELESVLAYLWTLGLKLSDLQLESTELTQIQDAVATIQSGQVDETTIAQIREHYLDGSPAHFVEPPADRKAGAGPVGRPDRGKIIYELSCQHCHAGERYSFYNIDDSNTSFKHLARHMSRYTRYSLYQVSRYGTSPLPGKRAYMPQYTREKMSDQQLEDLRAYIELMADSGKAVK